MNYIVCLPVLNEEESILFLIKELQEKNYPFFISDAGSSDKSISIAKENNIMVQKRSGKGKGYAVKDALEYCQHNNYEGLILLDCDRTYAVSDIEHIIAEFSVADMVVGCRNFKDITPLRRMANNLMTWFTNLLFNSQVKDMATGMRMLRVNKFLNRVTAESFDIEAQLHSIALRNNYIIKEIYISYSSRSGKSKINIYHLFVILCRLVIEKLKK